MNKFLMSSADATKYSTAFKGIAVSFIPIIMVVTGMTAETTQEWVDTIEKVIFFGTSFIAAIQVFYGLMRKLYLGRWSAKE